MARSYRTVEPADVVAAFDRQNVPSQIIAVGRSPWKKAVTVQGSALRDESSNLEYWSEFSILCGHDGKTALRITPKIVRGFCENEFSGACVSIPHTSREIDRFLADPVQFSMGILARCDRLMCRMDEFQDVPADDTTLQFWLKRKHKRLARHYLQRRFCSCGYPFGAERYDGDTAWNILQALSATRSPKLIDLASDALESEDVMNGSFDQWLYERLSAGPRPVPAKLDSLS
jgi:hypothetical protein